jgi:hypothetical protein
MQGCVALNGLLLKLEDDQYGEPGIWFVKLFTPIILNLDCYYWCFDQQPWADAPDAFANHRNLLQSFAGDQNSQMMLWKTRTLGRFARYFTLENVTTWAIDSAKCDPSEIAYRYCRADESQKEQIIRDRAVVIMIYHGSTSWEIYSTQADLLETVREHVQCMPSSVKVFESHYDHRPTAFDQAGLNDVLS